MSYPPPESMRPTLLGDRWSVVGGHPLVSHVAADVLARGGNAVDAGVAAGLASNVVQPDMCNFGGIASVLVRPAGDPTPYSVAGVGRWGARADRQTILDQYAGDLPAGGVPCIVPGAPSAWLTALERFGTWSFADVAAGAIELALDGFPLDLRAARSLEITGQDFRQWPSSREVYWPAGRPPHPGERLVQPALGRLLQDLAAAEHGATRSERLQAVHDAFYRGRVAEMVVGFVQRHGGYLDLDDLAGFRAEVAPAPSVTYGDWRVHVTPTWSQGLIVAQALGLMRGMDLKALGHNSSGYLHVVIEALKVAFDERERCYGDPAVTGLDPASLLTDEHLASLRAGIGERARANARQEGLAGPPPRSTTAVTVVDAGRHRVQCRHQRHPRRRPDHPRAGHPVLQPRRAEPTPRRPPQRARARQTSVRHALGVDRAAGARCLGDVLSGRRRDRAGDPAVLPRCGRLRPDAAAGRRGTAVRGVQLPGRFPPA